MVANVGERISTCLVVNGKDMGNTAEKVCRLADGSTAGEEGFQFSLVCSEWKSDMGALHRRGSVLLM
jgi:hypothetical protein